MRREQVRATPEHEREFRAAFELDPELADDPVAQSAYEHAAKYKLYPDELVAVGNMIRRKAGEARLANLPGGE